ncbi:MAG: M42 family metallopeptidase [TACK group archaeon]|nr:M42 family metallopeptidase [TACK group archaeon]
MPDQQFIELLRELSEAFGPSGHEEEVREIVLREMRPYADEIRVDKWGNAIGVRKGGKRTAMVAAHMDEIGLLVDRVEENGFLRFRGIGGWNEVTLVGQRAVLKAQDGREVKGVIGGRPPHVTPQGKEREAPELKELFIDAGFQSAADAEKAGVAVGTVGVLDRKFEQLAGDMVTGKAFDNRVGVAVMLWAIRELMRSEATIYFVATVQEEVGLRGAQVSADAINPDFAIALDTTIAADVPGVPERDRVTTLGKGPAIKVADGGRGGLFIAHPRVNEHLRSVASREGIPFQLEVLIGGSTDAQAIAFRRSGIPSTTISIPTRYVHSPVEVLSVSDALNAAHLLRASLESADEAFFEEISEKKLKRR